MRLKTAGSAAVAFVNDFRILSCLLGLGEESHMGMSQNRGAITECPKPFFLIKQVSLGHSYFETFPYLRFQIHEHFLRSRILTEASMLILPLICLPRSVLTLGPAINNWCMINKKQSRFKIFSFCFQICWGPTIYHRNLCWITIVTRPRVGTKATPV